MILCFPEKKNLLFMPFKLSFRKKGDVALYEIEYYVDKKGKSPIREFILGLAAKNDKDSRIRLNKIRDYVKALASTGRHSASHT